MAYHQGLLRQRGFGGSYHQGVLRQKGFGIPVGALLKIGAPLVSSVLAPVIGDLVGGLIKKQRGRGFVRDALKSATLNRALRTGAKHGIYITGNAAIDALDNKGSFVGGLRRHGTRTLGNVGGHVLEQQLRGRLPILNAPIINPLITKRLMPVIKGKVGGLIETNLNKVLGAQRGRGRKKRKKQRGRGVAADLIKMGARQVVGPLLRWGGRVLLRRGIKQGLKRGAEELVKEGTRQAIHSATKVGIDALKGKSLKESVVKRGQEGLQKTGMSMEEKLLGTPTVAKRTPKRTPQILARGGPKTGGISSSSSSSGSNKRKRKRTIKLGTGKKARTIDIFD